MKSIEWLGDRVRFIDQTKLPAEEVYVETNDPEVVCEAIRTLAIRGAPLIGIAGGYAVALAARKYLTSRLNEFFTLLESDCERIASVRPTAVNLAWAVGKVRDAARSCGSVETAIAAMTNTAIAIHEDDCERCRKIAEHGVKLIKPNSTVLTHCNTGALATGGIGTALGIIITAHKAGKIRMVYVDETRPLLQGSRLTMWELQKAGVPATLIADDVGAFLMQQKKIDAVFVGADRIAANGDVANKIGTYNLAVAAKHHGVPFYVAAPTSTIDRSLTDGSHIPIEERSGEELTSGFGQRTAPEGVQVHSPAFDVTLAALITGIITETQIFRLPYRFNSSEEWLSS